MKAFFFVVETLGMFRILCLFLIFFVSEKHSDYGCILEIIYISMFMKSDLDM